MLLPARRWPYESHKPVLMNTSVKAAAQPGLHMNGRSFGRKHALQKCTLIKMSRVSKLLKYICCSLMDLFPTTGMRVGFQLLMGLKESLS